MRVKPIFTLILIGVILGMIFHVRQNIIQSRANPVVEIISMHTKAMGGIDLWNQLRSYRIYQKRPDGMEVTLTAYKPNRCKIEFKKDSLYVIKSYNGKVGCVLKNGVIKDMRPGEQLEMAEEPMFYEELMQYKSRGYKIEYAGLTEVDDVICHKIELIKSDQDHQQYWIDAETYLIKLIAEYSDDPVHKGIYYKTSFDDFRKVDGYLFPFKSNLITDKRSVDLSSYKIEVNFDLDEDYFTCVTN